LKKTRNLIREDNDKSIEAFIEHCETKDVSSSPVARLFIWLMKIDKTLMDYLQKRSLPNKLLQGFKFAIECLEFVEKQTVNKADSTNDSDDYIDPELKESLRRLINDSFTNKDVSGFKDKIQNYNVKKILEKILLWDNSGIFRKIVERCDVERLKIL